MATIWRSQQRCGTCGWTGVTSAQRFIVRSSATYLALCLVLFGLYVGGVDLNRHSRWWFVVLAIGWYELLPSLVWRWNRCVSCKQRMKVELLPLVKDSKVERRPTQD